MRKSKLELPIVKAHISALKGKPIQMMVNLGRKKYSRFTGLLEGVYPSIFTVRLDKPITNELMSYSYSDVVCGDVKVSLLDA